ncbi:MAG: hypothetical protein IKZ07_05715 [Akkermansia sp.]|nr:hypothetical protein [Akkermansia sp.]
MSKKKQSSRQLSLLGLFDKSYVAEAEEFLQELEARQRRVESALAEESAERAAHFPTPAGQRLIERIEQAFDNVTSYRDVRGLLGGEAEDEYMSPNAQALLAPLEERDDWRRIPDSLLMACNCSLTYMAAGAYRFYLPAFICAALRGVNLLLFLGTEPPTARSDDFLRGKCVEFTAAQQACLSDYLNYESQHSGERERYWPWELDDYATNYAANMSLYDYGCMLVQRYCEAGHKSQ